MPIPKIYRSAALVRAWKSKVAAVAFSYASKGYDATPQLLSSYDSRHCA